MAEIYKFENLKFSENPKNLNPSKCIFQRSTFFSSWKGNKIFKPLTLWDILSTKQNPTTHWESEIRRTVGISIFTAKQNYIPASKQSISFLFLFFNRWDKKKKKKKKKNPTLEKQTVPLWNHNITSLIMNVYILYFFVFVFGLAL